MEIGYQWFLSLLKRRAKVLRLPQTHKKNREKTEFESQNNALFLQSLLFKVVFTKLNLFHHAELKGCAFMQGSPSSLLYVWHIHFIMHGTSISLWVAYSLYHDFHIQNIFKVSKIILQLAKYFFKLSKFFLKLTKHFVYSSRTHLFYPLVTQWFFKLSSCDALILPFFYTSEGKGWKSEEECGRVRKKQ